MRSILTLFLLVLLVSCTGPSDRERGGALSADSVIPRDRLVKITADVHIAEAALRDYKYQDKGIKDTTEKFYQFIWIRYHISRDLFLKNIGELKKDPEDFIRFYDDVIKELESRDKSTLKGKK